MIYQWANKRQKRYVNNLFFILLLIYSFNILSAQSPDCLDDLPLNYKIYLIGDVHLDQVPYNENISSVTLKDRAIDCQKKLLKRLIDSANVRLIVTESPICIEYYFSKYLITGDESYISFYKNFYYEYNQLKNFHALRTDENQLKIACFDTDDAMDPQFVLDALFMITFYEPFKKKEIQNIGFNVNLHLPYFDSIYQVNIIPDDSLNKLVNFIWSLKMGSDKNIKKVLYSNLSLIMASPDSLEILKSLYGENFDYFIRLANSYINGSGLHENRKNYFKKREPFLWYNLNYLLQNNANLNSCVLTGMFHAGNLAQTNNIHNYLTLSALNYFTIYTYYKELEYVYPLAVYNAAILPRPKECNIFYKALNEYEGCVYPADGE